MYLLYVKNIGTACWRVIVAANRAVNALLGGDPDMTLSGRMGLAVEEGRCLLCGLLCRLLDLVDRDHCRRQAAAEKGQGDDEVVKL